MFKHDALKGRVAVVTGGGGVLCSGFSKDLARQGMKVAVLDLRLDAAEKVAKEIRDEGFEAVGIACNVLEKESLESAREIVNKTFGTCDLLLNGAGGNHPSGTTTKDKLELSDLTEKAEGVKTFFDLDAKGIEFVMTALFVVMFIDKLEKERNYISAVIGIAASVLALIVLGPSNYLLAAMIIIIICFFYLYRRELNK